MKRLFMRVYHLMERILKQLRVFPKYQKNFGFKVACAVFWDGIIPPGKSKQYIRTIEEYVDGFTKNLVDEYSKKDWTSPTPRRFDNPPKIPVWCCWWQGIESMPELVKMCNARLKKAVPSDKAELHMITLKNYKTFVDIPQPIIDLFENGKITMTEMSDILRVALLSRHGGFWIDSTVFISGEFPEEFISQSFFVQKMFDLEKCKREACKGRWCGFLLSGSPDNLIFHYLRDAFYFWWENYDCVIDYVIFDYFLLSAYKRIPAVKKMVDAVPDNNVDVFEMYRVLDQPYSDELYSCLTKSTVLHKLTYKINLTGQTPDGQKTLYQYLLDLTNERVCNHDE